MTVKELVDEMSIVVKGDRFTDGFPLNGIDHLHEYLKDITSVAYGEDVAVYITDFHPVDKGSSMKVKLYRVKENYNDEDCNRA